MKRRRRRRRRAKGCQGGNFEVLTPWTISLLQNERSIERGSFEGVKRKKREAWLFFQWFVVG